ncbi:Hypothetical Protein FCC1311_042322 [Hondaea fermentalgiana]|uniref:Uncharacterized protein n=1 Tax=Hondaea fermentalgiana TaxID=2315210 RepID=A0A2R5GCD2_9STRA|nr:Hypothetical Protein FCC1311_042322 [Hondaea fermentalgiana]|eukprot:GBG28009.1 Hypothetical Protein FCC1311_042322 [Hondaea fermentalgiana]
MGMMSVLAGMVITVLPLVSVVALWIASLYDQRFANIVYKLHLLRIGLSHMIFSQDKRWPRQADAAGILDTVDSTKQIIFVRHGESRWNEVFNKGFGPSFPGRLFRALRDEFLQATTLDSTFLDSPLSEEGTMQAAGLAKFVESSDEGIGAVLKGLEGESVLVSSNLRRALSTATIGFWSRLQRTQEKIHILSCLQEVSVNVDCVALAKPQGYPELSDEELHGINMKKMTWTPERFFNGLENDGDKPVSSRGIHRVKDFAAWCFEHDEPTVIAAGHSLYARHFFNTFLPLSSTNIARTNKMKNCAVVAFTLERGKLKNGKTWYRIQEDSVDPLYLGFEDKGKKVKKRKSSKRESAKNE